MNPALNQKLYWPFFAILLTAVIADLGVPTLLSRWYPGYNHLRDTISSLGSPGSPVQRWQSLNLVVVGILFVIFAVGQRLLVAEARWPHFWYALGLILFGVGCVLAGIFPEDAAGAPESLNGKIHGIASGLGFLFLILNPLWMVWIQENTSLRILNILFFAASLITFLLFLASENRSEGWLSFTGLYQRLNLVFLYSSLLINYLFYRG